MYIVVVNKEGLEHTIRSKEQLEIFVSSGWVEKASAPTESTELPIEQGAKKPKARKKTTM